MLSISRRTFLALSGAVGAAAAAPGLFHTGARAAQGPLNAPVLGRALRAVPVRQYPAADAPVLRHLWPDSVTPLRARQGAWFHLPEGWAAVTDLQPVAAYDPDAAAPVNALPAWLGVIAPLAVVRAWAAGEAPIVARVGYGGVLCAVDRLVDDAGRLWYGVAPAPDAPPLGWTAAQMWAVADVAVAPAESGRTLRLDAARKQLSAWQDGRAVLRVPAVAPAVPGSMGMITSRQPTTFDLPVGAAWVLAGEGVVMYGAHWHHDFGRVNYGDAWQVAPWAARWLYGWLPSEARVDVIG